MVGYVYEFLFSIAQASGVAAETSATFTIFLFFWETCIFLAFRSPLTAFCHSFPLQGKLLSWCTTCSVGP